MAITYVNSAATENAASATYTVVLTWSQTAGDIICVCIWTSALTQVINSVTDTEGNLYYQAYVKQNSGNAVGGMQVMYVCANAAAAASSANTVTVKFSTSQTTATVGVMTFNSDNGFGYVDVLGVAATGHSTTATESVTPVNANTVVLGFITTGSGKVTTVTSGTLAINTATNGQALAYAIKTSAGAQAITATVGATNDYWAVGAIAIQKTAPVFTGAGVPTLVQHSSTAASAVAGGPYFINYPNKTLANNFLVAIVTAGYKASQTLTVTDDNSNTWTVATGYPVTDPSTLSTHWICYLANAGAGVRNVTFTFGTQTTATFELLEYYNVATSSPQDGHSTTVGYVNAPIISAGSFTPASSGDLILCYGYDWNTNTPMASAHAPGPGFKPLTMYVGDNTTSKCLYHTIQGTAGAINPTASVVGNSDYYACLSAAFKAATSGTAPSASAMRIVSKWTTLVEQAVAPTFQFPTRGNLLFHQSAFASAIVNWSANASNLGNTWTNVHGANSTIYPQMWYCANAVSGDNLTVTPTLPASPFITMQFYDIVNAATSPYDSTAGIPQQQITVASGTTLPTNITFNTATFTPSVANGIVFGTDSNGYGPAQALVAPSGSTAFFDSETYTGQTDSDNMVNADGYSHIYNANTSTLTWTWTVNPTILPESSNFSAIAFKPLITGYRSSPTTVSISVLNGAIPIRYIYLPMESA